MPPKTDPATRPMKGVAPHMIAIATAQEVRAALGDGLLIGRSTHNRAQVDAALAGPLDYLAVGPVFGTRSRSTSPACGA